MKSTLRVVVDMFSSISQNLLIILVILFSWNPRAFELILSVLLEMNPAYRIRVRRVLATKQVHVADTLLDKWLAKVLYWKDRLIFSDHKYFQLVHYLNLIGYLPGKTTLIRFRKRINEVCLEKFNVQMLDKKAFTLHGPTVVTYLQRLAKMSETEVTEVKVAFDGAAKGFVHAAVGLLNSNLPT